MADQNKPTKKRRFATVNSEEYLQIIKEKDSENTNRSTTVSVNIFRAYLKEKELDIDFESYEKNQLADVLEKFYVEARREDGELYKSGSMTNIRASLNRHLKNTGHVVNLLSDPEFAQANLSFAANKAKLKRMGLGDTQHYLPIDDLDVKKLYESDAFNQDTPEGLQNKVWFELMLYICRRGRENLRKLEKDHFAIAADSNGRRYVYQAKDELTKKIRADCMQSRVDGGRMYATGKQDCPVASFEKYISKLNPQLNILFQSPKKCAPACDDVPWYKNSPIGEKTLGGFMAKLSIAAGLSRRYTNHSIRTTCITLLDGSGFDTRDICSVSGHRNEQSIRTYVGKPNDAKKQRLSDAISSARGSSTKFGADQQPSGAVEIMIGQPSTSAVEMIGKPSSAVEEAYDCVDLNDLGNLEFSSQNSTSMEIEVLARELEAVEGLINRNSPIQSTRRLKMKQETRTAAAPLTFNNCNVTINYNYAGPAMTATGLPRPPAPQ